MNPPAVKGRTHDIFPSTSEPPKARLSKQPLNAPKAVTSCNAIAFGLEHPDCTSSAKSPISCLQNRRIKQAKSKPTYIHCPKPAKTYKSSAPWNPSGAHETTQDTGEPSMSTTEQLACHENFLHHACYCAILDYYVSAQPWTIYYNLGIQTLSNLPLRNPATAISDLGSNSGVS